MIYFIDLFCGAGGVTSGIHRARFNGQVFAKVVACVNHDPLAISSHYANHPDALHYVEKIQVLDLTELRSMVFKLRQEDPDCLIFIWASLECTNFSKAKGGLPRDADSRTLADHMFRYLDELTPDGLWIENVEEFMCWGPLDELGKPISKRNGEDYIKWVEVVKSYGFDYEYRILNAADYGAYTSRKRYFGQFMRSGIPITWPEATHCKKPSKGGMFGETQKWKAVKDVLDFGNKGESIFNRKRPLVEKSLERVYAGLLKFIAGGDDNFLSKGYSGRPKGKVISTESPAGTLTVWGGGGHSLVQASFIAKYYSGNPNGKVISVDGPAGTIRTKDGQSLIQSEFITAHYSNGKVIYDIMEPSGAITTKDRFSLCQPSFFLNPSWGGHPSSTDSPSPVIVARQDKAPIYLVTTESGQLGIKVFVSDSPCTKKIKEFMAAYGIVDIYMRMLTIPELLRIQGFGDGYVLKGNQGDQKRFIGNAVEVNQAKVLIEAFYEGLIASSQLKTA